jgi:hypothetical protein
MHDHTRRIQLFLASQLTRQALLPEQLAVAPEEMVAS